MESLIKKGDKVLIKDNLMDELVRIGFDKEEVELFVKSFRGKKMKVLDVYQNIDRKIGNTVVKGTNEWFVTVDLCCEIPINACEKI